MALPAGFKLYTDPLIDGTAAIAGCDAVPRQFSLIGRRVKTGQYIGVDHDGCLGIALVGLPKAGKGYLLGALAEGATRHYEGISHLEEPLCVVALNYRKGDGDLSELTSTVFANHELEECNKLVHEYKVLPTGLSDQVVLTLPQSVDYLRGKLPHSQVHGLTWPTARLGVNGLRDLFGLNDNEDPLYMDEIERLIEKLRHRRDLTASKLEDEIRVHRFGSLGARHYALQRMERGRRWLDDGKPAPRGFIRGGRVITIDVHDRLVRRETAMMIFRMAIDDIVLQPGGEGEPERPCNLLIILEEPGDLLRDKRVRAQVRTMYERRRHLGASIAAAAQDPRQLGPEILSIADLVAVGQTSAVEHLRYMGRSVEVFRRFTPALTRELPPGKFWLYARQWCMLEPGESFEENVILLDVRPRLSQHGGATRTATGRSGREAQAGPTLVYR